MLIENIGIFLSYMACGRSIRKSCLFEIFDIRSPFQVKKLQMKYTEYYGHKELDVTEKYLTNINNFIVANIIDKIKLKKNHRILDFGAGIGTLSEIIYQKTMIKPVCAEVDKKNISILTKKKFKVIDISKSKAKFDLIFSSNVLEHIKDDVEILKSLRSLLAKDGILYLYLPASQMLYSDFDKSIGHHRRYNKKQLIKKIHDSGFKIQKCRYSDSLGFFASLVVKLIGYKKNKKFILDKKKLIIYDKFIFKASLLFDNLLNNFFGKNIYLIAKK